MQHVDIDGTVVQRGNTEYLLTNGKARVLRRLSGDDYNYTRLGKQYFDAKQSQYLVHVPAIIKQAHSTSMGRSLMVPHNVFMPQDLEISSRRPDAERKRQLKAKVLTFMETT